MLCKWLFGYCAKTVIPSTILRKSCNVNSLKPRPNRRYFADDIFKWIFENENEWILPRISLKFVPKVWINYIPALVQIMAWRWPGDKSLTEPMMVSLLTHICVTRPQWVKHNFFDLFSKCIVRNILQIHYHNHRKLLNLFYQQAWDLGEQWLIGWIGCCRTCYQIPWEPSLHE